MTRASKWLAWLAARMKGVVFGEVLDAFDLESVIGAKIEAEGAAAERWER